MPKRSMLAALGFATFLSVPHDGRAGDAVPAPPALTDRELANAEAVTRLFGIVRFFHPSDQAAALDWDSATVATMRATLDARDDGELARRLERALAPVAPTVFMRRGESRTKPTLAAPAGASAFTYWMHEGVQLSAASNVYDSHRLRRAWSDTIPTSLRDSLPDPRRPFHVWLGSRISAWVPLALWTNDGGTLPRLAPVVRTPSTDSLRAARLRDSSVYSPRDRAVRLADVALAWMALDQFYPYFDVVQVDWDAELSRALRDAAAAKDACGLREVLARMVAALHDGHGAVRHACLPVATLRLRVARIEGRMIVVANDSTRQEVRVGDELLAIDGEPIEQRIARLRPGISAATAQFAEYALASGVLAGPTDHDVRIEILNRRGRRDTVVMERSMTAWTLRERHPPVTHEVRPGIWYVDLTRITTAQWNAALPTLEKASGLVFDMRGYPSQLEPEPFFEHIAGDTVLSAQWWVPYVVVPRTGPRSAPLSFVRHDSWRIAPVAPYLAAPKAFITDGRAISYAESVMSIVEHYRLGAIVGEATAGTNGNVNPFTLPGGYDVRWTGMRVLKHDGSRHHGVGIQPTVPVQRTRAGVAAGRDELLERAIAIVSARAVGGAP